jgi:hypothetical protein
MLRQIGNCHCFASTKPLSKKYQCVRGEKLSGRPFCGEAVTSAPHLFAGGVSVRVGGHAVSCTASTKQRSETKPWRINIFLLVYDIHSVNFFLKYCTLLSQTHTPITDRFGLLGKRQVRGGTNCKAVCCCTLGCLHTQPAHSMHVKPTTGMAPMTVSEMWPLSGASSWVK